MIEERFDSRTLAAMNAALDRVCGQRRTARNMPPADALPATSSAKGGRTTLTELTEAGYQALAKLTAVASTIAAPVLRFRPSAGRQRMRIAISISLLVFLIAVGA